MGEVSKGYSTHTLDGASAIVRDINNKMIKTIHMQWLRSEGAFSTSTSTSLKNSNLRNSTTWIHYTELNNFHQVGAVSGEQKNIPPYFILKSNSLSNNQQNENENENDDEEYENGSSTPRYNNMNKIRSSSSSSSSFLSSKSSNRVSPSISDQMDFEWESLLNDENENENEDEVQQSEEKVDGHGEEGKYDVPAVTQTVISSLQVSDTEEHGENTDKVADLSSLQKFNRIQDANDLIQPSDSIQDESKCVHREDPLTPTTTTTTTTISSAAPASAPALAPARNALFQHVNLFFDDAEESILVPNFFTLNDNHNDSMTMNEIRDLLCASLQPHLDPSDVRVWVRDKGNVADKTGAGILYSGPKERSSSTAQNSDVLDMDDQFERSLGRNKNIKKNVPATDNIPPEIIEENPYGPKGRTLTMEKTDIVSSWRYLRPNMYGTPLSSLCAAPSNYPVPASKNQESGEKVGAVLDLKFELRTEGTSFHSNPILEEWRNNIQTGDVVDVLFNDSIVLGPVWVEGKVVSVSQRGYGYRGAACTIEMLLAASAEFLQKRYDLTSVSAVKPFTCIIESSSTNMQPLYSHSDNWRSKLDVNSQVYGTIIKGNWLPATVISCEADGGDGEGRMDLISLHLDNIGNNKTLKGGKMVKMIKSMDRYSQNLALFQALHDPTPLPEPQPTNEDKRCSNCGNCYCNGSDCYDSQDDDY